LVRALDVAFAERVMGQPTSSDNYRGYDVSSFKEILHRAHLVCQIFNTNLLFITVATDLRSRFRAK